jgi:hypothetical protein
LQAQTPVFPTKAPPSRRPISAQEPETAKRHARGRKKGRARREVKGYGARDQANRIRPRGAAVGGESKIFVRWHGSINL